MFENFSRRHKLDYEDCNLRYEYIPNAFRFDLVKSTIEGCEESIIREYCYYRGASISIGQDHFQLFGVDEIQEFYSSDLFIELIRKAKWHSILSIIEYLLNEGPLYPNDVNELFKYHNVGYEVEEKRHDESFRVVVKYDQLIEENDRAIESDIKYVGVIASIKSAKESLIDPKNIDIENSIRNSISAIEGYLKGWLGEKGYKKVNTLGDAVKLIKKEKLVQDNIIESLHQFYIYRNRIENIGHGAPSLADVTSEDALLFNEMSISFINYIYRSSQEQA